MSRNPKTANVPKVPAGLDRSLAHFLTGVKESIEVSRGRAGDQESFVTKKYLKEKGYATTVSETSSTPSSVPSSSSSSSTPTRQPLGTHEVQTKNIADGAVTEVKIAEGAVITRLDVLDMIDAAGGTYLALAVADITDPVELADYSGSDGSLLIAYEVNAAQDPYTIYAFDSANASGASSPYVVAGITGFWVAIAGTYASGVKSLRLDDGGIIGQAAGPLLTFDDTNNRLDIAGCDVGIGVVPTARNNTTLQIKDGVGFPSTPVMSTDANTLDEYKESTWTPTVANMTEVDAATYSGSYTKIGNRVSFEIMIIPGTSTASTAGSTTITLPSTPGAVAVGSCADAAIVSLGNGVIYTDGKFYPPTWAANTNRVYISGSYRV